MRSPSALFAVSQAEPCSPPPPSATTWALLGSPPYGEFWEGTSDVHGEMSPRRCLLLSASQVFHSSAFQCCLRFRFPLQYSQFAFFSEACTEAAHCPLPLFNFSHYYTTIHHHCTATSVLLQGLSFSVSLSGEKLFSQVAAFVTSGLRASRLRVCTLSCSSSSLSFKTAQHVAMKFSTRESVEALMLGSSRKKEISKLSIRSCKVMCYVVTNCRIFRCPLFCF